MDIRELDQLTPEQEMGHWWMGTRFLHLDFAVASTRAQTPSGRLRVLEMGCGSGQNLRYLRTRSPLAQRIGAMTGVDPNLDPARIERGWMGPEDRLTRDEASPEAAGTWDLLVAMDVLEHIEDDRGALTRWASRLAPGGTAFLTVPAFPMLWSEHDVRLAHVRRYRKRRLLEVALAAGLVPETCSYIFGHLFVPALVLRKLLGARSRAATGFRPSSAPVNSALLALGALEARLGGNPWFGTSLAGRFRKPGGSA
jgi:SAM-dependent methyltransferase